MFITSFIVDQNHVKIYVISGVPVFQRNVGFLLKFGDSVNVTKCQKVFFNEDNEIPPSFDGSFFF